MNSVDDLIVALFYCEKYRSKLAAEGRTDTELEGLLSRYPNEMKLVTMKKGDKYERS